MISVQHKNKRETTLSSLGRKKRILSAVAPTGDEWMEIEVAFDSGACEIVKPADLCRGIQMFKSITSHGAEYEVANGESILNLREALPTHDTQRDGRKPDHVPGSRRAQASAVD